MTELALYVIIGLILGFLVALPIFRYAFKGGSSQHQSSHELVEIEGNLRVANDRIARLTDDVARRDEEIGRLEKLKDEHVMRLSSADTLMDEMRKNSENSRQEQVKLQEEHNKRVEAFQELSRSHSGLQIRVQTLNEQLASLAKELETLKDERKVLQSDLSAARERGIELEKENKYQKEMLEKQKAEMEEIGKKFAAEFKILADAILEDKSKRFTEINQKNIEGLLKPLGENLSLFQKKVEEVYDRESKERFSLGKEVEKLVLLNQRISEEANNLTNALKGQVKQMGNWGEMILESILEKSGLVKGREYFVQESLKSDEGQRLQPDVIIAYPDKRRVVVDSKVSLVAYERYCSSDSPDDQARALAEHMRSVKMHVDTLSSKNYQDTVGSLDFVMMFVPIEPAFMLAMQTDNELWNYAYNRRVLIISPTNLIAALKLIYDLWQREHQNKHAIEIAERGGRLYDKFVGFVDSLKTIGHHLDLSKESYEAAFKQLSTGSGNLVSQAQKIKMLGAKAKKSLSDSLLESTEDESTRALTEPE